MESKNYKIDLGVEIPFHNNADYCIGTGRMGLALHKEYQEQLAFVQEEIGFEYIRGHGLFTEDCAIYQEYTDESGVTRAEYNFTYLNRIIDSYLKLGIRPFLELGFMPEKMASGEQTVFYWKGNVTPPKSYQAWCDLVQATLRHLIKHYGEEEVVGWPIEVWNEPNLPGFWKDADMEEYFHLFASTFQAVKDVDNRFRVGGPAICGVEDELWIRSFMEFCSKEKIPLDFVTRHHYTTELPQYEGHYGYAKLTPPEDGFANLKTTRDIIDSFEEYKGLEIHITEFNTSYIPNCPIHDTNQNAAYLAGQLARLGEVNESYSYWTFGDVFEEIGVPFTPFHGGFGLVANDNIPKPTFYTFQFFKELKGTCLHKSEEAIIVSREDQSYCGVAWNCSLERSGRELELTFHFPTNHNKEEYFLLIKTVDEEKCNPLKLWHDMGEPPNLSDRQKKLLREASRPALTSKRINADEGKIVVNLQIKEHGLCYFELAPICGQPDRGYDYDRVMQLSK